MPTTRRHFRHPFSAPARSACAVGALAVLCGPWSGCASRIASRPEPPTPLAAALQHTHTRASLQAAGAGAQSVFLPPALAAAAPDPTTLAVYHRRDEALRGSLGRDARLWELGWPDHRTSVEHTRRVTLPTRAESILFYLPSRDRAGGFRSYYP